MMNEEQIPLGHPSLTREPLVSLMMIAYNSVKFLSDAVYSVLLQTYPYWELIINDDRSSDGTWELAQHLAKKDPRIRVYQNDRNLKTPGNRAAAMQHVKGDLVGHIDADDMLFPHSVAMMVEHLNNNPDVAMAYSDFAQINEKGHVGSYNVSKDYMSNLAYFGWRPFGVYRMSAFSETDGYNTKLTEGCEDGDLFMQIAEKYKFMRVQHVLYYRRSHGNNTSSRNLKCATCPDRPVCNYVRVWSKHAGYDHLTFIKLNKITNGSQKEASLVRPLTEDWRSWLKRNRERGCALNRLFDEAAKQGFDSSEISAELGGFCPQLPLDKGVSIEQRMGWSIYINRCKEVFHAAIDHCESRLESLANSDRGYLAKKKHERTFCYFDTFGGLVADTSAIKGEAATLIDRTITNTLSDKLILGQEVDKLGLLSIFPKTYATKEDALKSKCIRGSRLVFVKGRYGAGGEQVQCLKFEDLENTIIPKDHVLQEGVENLYLYEQRKAVFRVYITVYNGRAYLSQHAFAVIHGSAYDPESTDYDIQIKHSGYQLQDSPVVLLPLSLFPDASNWLRELVKASTALLPVLEPVMRYSSPDSYALLGVDVLPLMDGSVQFIEINNYPNLIHTESVNQLVNVPMLASLLLLTIGSVLDTSLILLGDIQR